MPDSAPPPTAPAPSGTFGRYRLMAEVARGGMGVVYRAFDPATNRAVALKIMLEGSSADAERFQREVRTVAQLSHPNIVGVHDVGLDAGKPYYTMTFIEGPSLAQLIKDMGRLPPRAAARIARDVARALEAAHEKGIIHRDLKPANILLQGEGAPSPEMPSRDTSIRLQGSFTDSYRGLLADFGLAKEIDSTRKITLTGAVLGTPAYMSPEQAAGDPVGPVSDVYSLAAVLYEMLTGAAPFAADNVNALLIKVIHDDPATLPPGLHVDLRTIVAKGMAKEPHLRYAGAKDLADDLDRFLAGEAIAARPARLLYRVRKWLARHPYARTAILTASVALATAVTYAAGPAWVEVQGERRFHWPAGRREIVYESPDHEPARERVLLGPWQTTRWAPTLVKTYGFVEVLSQPPGAAAKFVVAGKGVVEGAVDGHPIRVDRGTHEMRLAFPDHIEYAGVVTVRSGETTRLEKTLEHESGFLSATCEPEGVRMTVAGRTYALPIDRLGLPTGEYDVLFEKDNHFASRAKVRVGRGPSRSAPPAGNGLVWARDPAVAYTHASLRRMELWSFPAPAPVKVRPAIADLDADGLADAVAASEDGLLFAVNGRTGALLWQAPLPAVTVSSPALADFDRDGYPDAVCGSSDGSVSAFSGRDGTPLWRTTTGSAVSSSPAAADFNGDGIPDVVVGSEDSRLYFLSGATGERLWRFETELTIVSSPAVADLDLDGIPDAVVGSRDAQLYAVSFAKKKALWVAKTEGDVTSSPVLADLDGDGTPDAAVGSDDMHVYAFSGRDGRLLWKRPTGGKVRSSPASADLDGDSIPDVVVGSDDGRVHALAGRTGAPLWTHRTEGRVASSPLVADLDGDGKPECAVGSDDGHVRVLSARGTLLWEFRTGGPVVSSPAAGDLDGDGRADVVAGSNDGRLHALAGPEAGVDWESRVDGEFHFAAATADLDGDGVPDVAGTTSGGRVMTLSGRDGARIWEFKAAAGFSVAPALGDLDGDRAPEVIAGSNDGLVHALAGATGVPRWTFKLDARFSGTPAVLDLDGDRVPDVIGGTLFRSVYAISGKDGRQIWMLPTEGAVWSTPAFADMNRDGVPDCVCTSLDSSTYVLSGRNGQRVWQVKTNGGISSAPVLADLNGDGVPDVVVGTLTMIVFALSGGENGRELWFYKPGQVVFASPALADLNGDGVPDVIAGSSDRHVHAMNGRDGALLWKFATGNEVRSTPAVAELDGDGVPDILSGSNDGNLYAISGRTGAPIWSYRAGREVRSTPMLADLDGDGVPDAVLGAGADRVVVLSGRTGRPLRVFEGARRAVLDGRRLLVATTEGTIQAWRFRAAPASMAALLRQEAWRAVIERAEGDLAKAAGRRELLHARGLARLRTGDAKAALADFRAASKAGLVSPELHADWMEACVAAGEPIDVAAPHPGAAALLLSTGRLTEERRRALGGAVRGTSPALLILAGKPDEALAALPQGDTWDWRLLSLRALARREKGDAAGARVDLEHALRENPYSRDLRRQMGDLAPRPR